MTITAPATTESVEPGDVAAPCPPWCVIDEHRDWDGDKMHHMAWTNLSLSSYREADALMIGREQVRDHPFAVTIQLPDGMETLEDPDGIVPVRLQDSEVMLTVPEAQEAGVALLVMSGPMEGTIHSACAPGDSSPCCPGSPLRASAYQAAVFCPGCGSLYWRRQQ